MNRIEEEVLLSYEDILLVPYDQTPCSVRSRKDPDISTEVCPGVKIDIPIVSSPMDTITGSKMAIAMDDLGGLGILTRRINDPHCGEAQLKEVIRVSQSNGSGRIACAVGVRECRYDYIMSLLDNGLNILCIDIANGMHEFMQKAVYSVRGLKEYYDFSIIAGNVATGNAALQLARWGVDCIKTGVGPGACCLTRRVTGFGVPQLSAIRSCVEAVKDMPVSIMADGGCKTSGDIVKALWAGADSVMLGYMLAGHDESPMGDRYRGMSSRTVHNRADVASEGIDVRVPHKGPVKDTVGELAASIKAGCSMANALNLGDLRSNVHAIRVSPIGVRESDTMKGI